jgi:SAM-dependent methyltransferase
MSTDDDGDTPFRPSSWVSRHAALAAAGGNALDLAAGAGRHARWLLERGYHVVALDIDTTGLADLAGVEGVEIVAADLEGGAAWPLADRRFDLVIVTNYLFRPILPDIGRSLAPGGVLIYETFAAGNEEFGRPRNPDYLLRPGELLEAFGKTLQVVAYEHGIETEPQPAVRQRLVAVADDEPRPFPSR